MDRVFPADLYPIYLFRLAKGQIHNFCFACSKSRGENAGCKSLTVWGLDDMSKKKAHLPVLETLIPLAYLEPALDFLQILFLVFHALKIIVL